MEQTTQQRIDALKLELAKLEEQLRQERSPNCVFKPKEGQLYWNVNRRGSVDHFYYNGGGVDSSLHKTGNMFETREEAEAATPRFYTRLMAMQKLRNMAEGPKLDWDIREFKWCIYYNHRLREWKSFDVVDHRFPGTVYFRTEKDALAAIASLTEQELNSLLEE